MGENISYREKEQAGKCVCKKSVGIMTAVLFMALCFLFPQTIEAQNNAKEQKTAKAVVTKVLAAEYVAEPRREFRGAWVHTVGNEHYRNMTVEQLKQHFIALLDSFKELNINAVVFQVRPQADAFYKSDIEPWSRFITGTQGVAPSPEFDPLEFMVEECHKRGMELHAWFNPYRVTSNDKEVLVPDHLYFKKPWMFVKYGRQIYFNPGEPESRKHTLKVIEDVVRRYDIDAVHFDDYFYPYKVYDKNGKEVDFPDKQTFEKYGKKDGFNADQINDWRRNNVSLLIEELDKMIKEEKPWVKFGISPFGVWRNIANDPSGSNTKAGCQNYDDLYADIRLWTAKGWIDYNVPQLYWDIGHPAADFETLINWWNENNFGANLYIGESIDQTVHVKSRKIKGEFEDQLPRKMELVRTLANVHGNVWWPGYAIPRNPNGFSTELKGYQSHIALMPKYPAIDTIAPEPVENLHLVENDADNGADAVGFAGVGRGATGDAGVAVNIAGGNGAANGGANEAVNSGRRSVIKWNARKTHNKMQQAVYFCIYLDNEQYPEAITRDPFYILSGKALNAKKIRVTALDRLQNESAEVEIERQ